MTGSGKAAKIVRGAVFLCLLVVFVFQAGKVLENKNAEKLSGAYFSERKGTHDVLFLGPSTIMNGVYPAELWHEYGVTSYNLATGNQSAAASYYLAAEAIRRDHPRVIVLDCGKMRLKKSIGKLSYLHYITDRMPLLGANRLAMIRYIAKERESTFDETVGLYLPITQYHHRWTDLTEKDFEKDEKAVTLGAKVDVRKTKLKFEAFQPYEASPDAALPAFSDYWLREIIRLCDETGTDLLLITMPNMMVARYVKQSGYEKRIDAAAAVGRIADELDVPYLNLLKEGETIGLDPLKHTVDGQHFNVKGSTLFTEWLGGYLTEHFQLTDHRGEAQYAYMDARYEAFSELIEKKTGK